MRASLRKIFADLRSRRLQTALLFIILAAATTTLSTAITVQRNMTRPWERAFKQANGTHVWFYGQPDSDLSPITRLEGVRAVSGPISIGYGFSLIVGPEQFDIRVMGMQPELPQVGRPLLVEGRWLAAGSQDEIVIERSLANYLNYQVGDTVLILTPGGKVPLTIVGLAIETSYGLYPNWQPGTTYVLTETLDERLRPKDSARSQYLGIQLKDPDATQAFIQQAMALYPANELNYISWDKLRTSIGFETRMIVIFLSVFSAFALLAVCLIIVNAIGGTILAQFREIGLLKAIGFTPGQITRLYLLENMGIAGVAGLVGLALSMLLAPSFLSKTANLLNAPAVPSFDWASLLGILLGVEALVALATLLPAWQGGRIRTVQAITVGFARVQKRPSLLARLASACHLPPVIVLGLKDTFARPLRTALTVFGLALTILTITFTLTVEQAIRDFVARPALRGQLADIAVERKYISDAQARQMLADPQVEPSIAAFYSSSWVSAQVAATSESIGTRALSDRYDQFDILIPQGRMFRAPGEAVAGKGLLDMLHLKIGDDLDLLVDGKPFRLHIVGQYVEMSNMGQMVMYDIESLRQQADPEAEVYAYGLKLKPGSDPQALRDTLRHLSDDQLVVDISNNAPPSFVHQLRLVMLGLNAILVGIGLANLLNSTLMGVRERVRDFGIFKAIGLTPGQVILSVTASVSLLALMGLLVGIPLGMGVSSLLFTSISNWMGLGAVFSIHIAWWQLAILVPGVLILTWLGSLLPAHRAAAVKVVEVLRYE